MVAKFVQNHDNWLALFSVIGFWVSALLVLPYAYSHVQDRAASHNHGGSTLVCPAGTPDTMRRYESMVPIA